MSNNTPVPEGQNPIARGDGSPNLNPTENDPTPEPKEPKREISYESHRRLLDEKKKIQEKLDVFEREKQERERLDLEKKGEFQKVVELEKKRADEAEAKFKGLNDKFTEASKLSKLLKALDNSVEEKFYNFLPTDKIIVDPDTGEINMTSVAEAAKTFKTSFPELIKKKSGSMLPADAPRENGANMIAESTWKALPGKEMSKWQNNQILWGK